MALSSEKKLPKLKNRNPTIVCYKTIDDLITLKDWFYNFSESKDNRFRAVQRVKAFSSRGKVPHAIESTSLLTSICLSDPSTSSNHVKQTDSNILQLSYTMALIRFVNGLLDPFQQSNFAIPLHQLARNLNLPSFFVELRHMGTHESLPSIDILRLACTKALNWLYDNYWNRIKSLDIESDNEIDPEELSEKDINFIRDTVNRSNEIISNITANLKVFKKIRKQNLDVIYKFGNSSEAGIKYWKSIKNIKSHLNNDSFLINVLLFKNFMIYNYDRILLKETNKKFKFNSLLVKLYKPLFDEFGISFKIDLLITIFNGIRKYKSKEEEDIITSKINEKLGFQFKHKDEINQLLEWSIYLIRDILSTDVKLNFKINGDAVNSKNDLLDLVLIEVAKLTNEYNLRCLNEINATINEKPSSFHSDSKDAIKVKIDKLENDIKIKSFAAPPSLDELLGTNNKKRSNDSDNDLENGNKKPKLVNESELKHTNRLYLFEEHSGWFPIPFGNYE